MNIEDILKENGYKIIRQIDMKFFILKFTDEELEKRLKEKDLYDYDLEGQFNVKISEIGFNGAGGLYIVFTCGTDEHFEVGDIFEVIEY